MEQSYRELIKSCLFYILIAVSAVAFVFTGLIVFKGGQKTINQIISDSFIYFIMGILISRLFEQQGMLNGKTSQVYLMAQKTYNERVSSAYKHVNELRKWCEEDNARVVKIERTHILSRVGLKYDDCFFADGTVKEVYFELVKKKRKATKEEKAEYKYKKFIVKQKNKAYKKALNYTITKLTEHILMNNSTREKPNETLNINKNKYLALSSAKDVISKLVLTVIFGYFVYDVVQEVTWQQVIYKFIMVIVLIITGAVKMVAAERFVEEDLSNVFDYKTSCLTRFENDMKEQSI